MSSVLQFTTSQSIESLKLPVGGAALALTLLLIYHIAHTLIRHISDSYLLRKIPPVRGGYPLFGQVFEMLKGSPWDTMASWVHTYGMIFRLHLFGSDAIVVSDPILLKDVLMKYNTYKKDLEWTYQPFLVLLGNGLVTADGSSWMAQRTLLSNYLKVEILNDIPDMALRAVERLCIKLDKAKELKQTIDMAEEFRHLTLQVIAEAILSLSPDESDKTFAQMYLPIVEEGNLRTWSPHRMFLPTPAWFKFQRDVKRLDDYVTNLIEKRWALRLEEAASSSSPSSSTIKRKQDVLDTCLAAIPQSMWSAATIKQIRDEVKTFILAGHETSASMLTWSLYELMTDGNKENLDRVLSEGKAVYGGNSATLPSRIMLDKLEFTECCLRESLRKYSVVPTVVRKVAAPTVLGKYALPRGTTIMVCIQGVHHNPEFWPSPMEYRPSRFLEPIKPYTFLPFVEGPRMCLGQFLSILESKVVLSLILQRYSFDIVNTEDAGQKHAFMVPIIPKAGHIMLVK